MEALQVQDLIEIGVFAAGCTSVLLAVNYVVRKYRINNAARLIQCTWRSYRHNQLGLEIRRTVVKAVFDDRKKTQRIGVADELNFRQLKATLIQRRQRVEEGAAQEAAAWLIQKTWERCARRQQCKQAALCIQNSWKTCPHRRRIHADRSLKHMCRAFTLRKHALDCLISNSKEKAEKDLAIRSQRSYSYKIDLVSGNNIPGHQAFVEIINGNLKWTTNVLRDKFYLNWKFKGINITCKGTETSLVRFKVLAPGKLVSKCIGSASIELNPLKDENHKAHFLSLKVGEKFHERAGLIIVVKKESLSAPVA